MNRIYLDHAATTAMDPAVIKAVEPYFFEKFGNASSPHTFGQEARKALEDARQTVASLIGGTAQEIIFTSGGTEANNQAVFGVAQRMKDRGNHVIVSAIEHHSVLEPAQWLARQGFKVTYVRPDSEGRVNPQEIAAAVTDKTILIAVMHANNEIGTIQPAAAIGRIARERKIPFLVDAVQTVGHIPVNVNDLHADLLTMSAHKFYGPKGVGALYVRKGTLVSRILFGGDQESNLRASTQNVAGTVGMARALQLSRELMAQETETQTRCRDRLLTEIPRKIQGVKVNGPLTDRLPNNAHFSFEKISGEALLMALDMVGIAASMGSACTSGALEPSHVLRSIGLSDELALGSLRLTLGRWTKEEDVDYLIEQLSVIVDRLRI